MSGGGPPGPPPVPPLEKLPGPPNSKKLKGRARIKSMVKSSTWDWKGSSLDPEFRRPRISLKRKREESESSDSSAKTASQEGSDQEDLFPEKAQSRHIARKCPGLLARYAIKEARKRLLMEMGEDSSSQKPVPVFVRYFRQVFNHSGASAPMKREYLTLAHCLDSILEGNVLKLLDIAVQRLKAVEQISQGVSPATANRLELIPAEMFSLASAEEKRTEAQEQMREMKTSWNLNSWNPSSWNPKGKGWGKPQVEDSGAKGDKNSKGGKAKDQKGKPGGKWRPPKGVPALSSEVVVEEPVAPSRDIAACPNPPAIREESAQLLSSDVQGLVTQLGPLLRRWILLKSSAAAGVGLLDSSKHHSTAEVFPLPMFNGDLSPDEHAWLEEVHSALAFTWANVEHSLPQRELAGALDGVSVASGGIKDFLANPWEYLKPEPARTWMTTPRVMVSAEEWPRVAAGLVERRICDVIPLSQVLHVQGKPVLGGLFGVPKMEEVDGVPVLRLIMDLRPINQLFEAIAGDLHTLPMLSQLFPLEIFPDDNILVSSEDIKVMFYIVGLGESWRPLLAFGKEVPDHMRPAGVSEPCVLSSPVLPMGFINSVSVAQTLHRNIVNFAIDRLKISREAEVRRDQPLPNSALAYRVYLDNFDLLERKNREAACLLSGELSAPAAELRRVYEDFDIPVNEKKSVKTQLVGEMQGGLIDGKKGIVRPKPDKVARYLRGAWYLLQSKRTDLKRIQMVAGGLVYLFSYKRCLMSCLNDVWGFISSFEGRLGVWKPIPDSVREELFCCAALAPPAFMNLRAPYDSTVTASDASESGGGLSFSSGLTPFGNEAAEKSVRGCTSAGTDDDQVLLISLFDGVGTCRVALDVLRAKVAGYVAIETDAAARRVVESAFASTEFVHSLE
ncbi:unnamed protein product [Symbiodinium pilosum]|uniref:Reverse transcriptase domain-containing protein n=1 Tax=Symbiodinium pilosum TaxID=2952 RepID=A0A812KIA5_SYMPI|nr:unnamed protein product [Symbiodinium pilosum]